MKWITLLLPLLFLSLPAHAETALPAPEVRLTAIHPVWNGNGSHLHLQMQIKPQEDASLAGEVEVAGPLVLTDEKGAPLGTLKVEPVKTGRAVDRILFLTCQALPECDWFRVGGTLRVTQGKDVRTGARHTCPTDKESSFADGGITFTVNGEADRALAERIWNERIPRVHPKGLVWISCDAADARHIKSWELAGRKGMDLHHIHRETRSVEGRFIWFMGYDSLQREVQLRPELYDTVQTVEVPVDCIAGINGQAKEVSPLSERDSTPGPRLRMESLSWNNDDFPGMGGMIADPEDALTIKLSVDHKQGTVGGRFIGAPGKADIKVTDAKGRHIPCKIHTQSDKIHLIFRDTRPEGTWLKLEGTLPFISTGDADPTPIRLDGIYTLRGRR